MKTDVLIVGAGPTGLMLANQLARRGLRPLIIDRHPGPSLQTRALGVQARTLEIYAKMGLAERAIELGKRGNGAHLWSEGRQIGAVSLSDAGRQQTPYPYILVLGQDDNERIMGEKLRELGVRRPVEHRAAGARAALIARRGDSCGRQTARLAPSRRHGSPAATAHAAPCAR